ncbi:site-2 protease family protein [Runella aurantiaca]|uniref:Site-2 protease family protein n=1 Tax=Runella aurantiaca TaxID=2282308 RepID=A0A369I279_9BACT|nr:site-2 protease family protein [Runella aurantiaca]RDB02355.1 site-2 protease family protein [Runella aurantiaca]
MKNQRTLFLQISLFIVTLATTSLSGAEWMFGRPFDLPFFKIENPLGWSEFWQGFRFSIPFLGILTVHEFGHYFAAKRHHVRVTLPYYIPLWLGFGQTIGTLGAFIRIKEFIRSRVKYFDIGIAGPLAGFVVAVGVLWYGFATLPTLDYIFKIHPEYQKFGMGFARVVYANQNTSGNILLGDNLLFSFFKNYVADPTRLPPPQEIMHYPLILAGYLALFFTSLNLIPIGQLDGGHVLYGLIGGKNFKIVAPILFFVFITYAGLGSYRPDEFAIADNGAFWQKIGSLGLYILFLQICFSRITDENPLTSWMLALLSVAIQFGAAMLFPTWEGYPQFLVFGFILGRILGVHHPPTEDILPLNRTRQILGWLTLLIFVLCFSPKPFVIM